MLSKYVTKSEIEKNHGRSCNSAQSATLIALKIEELHKNENGK